MQSFPSDQPPKQEAGERRPWHRKLPFESETLYGSFKNCGECLGGGGICTFPACVLKADWPAALTVCRAGGPTESRDVEATHCPPRRRGPREARTSDASHQLQSSAEKPPGMNLDVHSGKRECGKKSEFLCGQRSPRTPRTTFAAQ